MAENNSVEGTRPNRPAVEVDVCSAVLDFNSRGEVTKSNGNRETAEAFAQTLEEYASVDGAPNPLNFIKGTRWDAHNNGRRQNKSTSKPKSTARIRKVAEEDEIGG